MKHEILFKESAVIALKKMAESTQEIMMSKIQDLPYILKEGHPDIRLIAPNVFGYDFKREEENLSIIYAKDHNKVIIIGIEAKSEIPDSSNL